MNTQFKNSLLKIKGNLNNVGFLLARLASQAGFEPATHSLEGCSLTKSLAKLITTGFPRHLIINLPQRSRNLYVPCPTAYIISFHTDYTSRKCLRDYSRLIID